MVPPPGRAAPLRFRRLPAPAGGDFVADRFARALLAPAAFFPARFAPAFAAGARRGVGVAFAPPFVSPVVPPSGTSVVCRQSG